MDDFLTLDHNQNNIQSLEQKTKLYIVSPSSALKKPSQLPIATERLEQWGFSVTVDPSATKAYTRFAGTDQERVQAFHNAALSDSEWVMATRGGYGINRILHQLDWDLIASHPKKYIGYSDFTAFNMALYAKTGMISYQGPNAVSDFGQEEYEELNAEFFIETVQDQLEVFSFESPKAQEIDTWGVLWGGNLAMINSLLGTPYFPKIKNGILFLEDVAEHPYRIERMLTQLLHAGVFENQKAILLGEFSDYKLSELDRGYNINHVIEWLKLQTKLPVFSRLPFGHGQVRVTLPFGKEVGLGVEDNQVYLLLNQHSHD